MSDRLYIASAEIISSMLLQGKTLKKYAMAVIERSEPLSGDQSFDYNKLESSLGLDLQELVITPQGVPG